MTMSALPQDREAGKDFYRRQLAWAFRHSRPFYEPLGTVSEQVADSDGFAAIVAECAPGSLEAARRIGEMAAVLLGRAPTLTGATPGEWWHELLQYERACFLQMATTVETPPANRPRRGLSALGITFAWQVPAVIKLLERGAPVPDELHRPITLLFSRRASGEACVVEVGDSVERVFRATNGLRTEAQIAAAAGVDAEQAAAILESLTGIGAVVPAASPDQMLRALEGR